MNVRSARLAPAGGKGKLAWRTANTMLWVRIGSSAALNSATSTRLPLSLSRSRTVTRPAHAAGRGHGLAQGANDAAREVVVLAERVMPVGRETAAPRPPGRIATSARRAAAGPGPWPASWACPRVREGAGWRSSAGLSLAGVSLAAASSAGRGDGFAPARRGDRRSFGWGSGLGHTGRLGRLDGGGGSLAAWSARAAGQRAGHAGRGRVERYRRLAPNGGIDDHDADAVGRPERSPMTRGEEVTKPTTEACTSAASRAEHRTGAGRRDAWRASGSGPAGPRLASAPSAPWSCHQLGRNELLPLSSNETGNVISRPAPASTCPRAGAASAAVDRLRPGTARVAGGPT